MNVSYLLSTGPSSSTTNPSYRLIVVSSRARNKLAIYASVLPHVIAMEYSFESNTLQDIAGLIRKSLTKVIYFCALTGRQKKEVVYQ